MHPLLTPVGRRHWGVIMEELNQDFFYYRVLSRTFSYHIQFDPPKIPRPSGSPAGQNHFLQAPMKLRILRFSNEKSRVFLRDKMPITLSAHKMQAGRSTGISYSPS